MLRFFGAFFILCLAPGALRAEPPAVEDFFAKPTFSNLKLSPSGAKLAVPGVSNGTEYLATIDLATMQSTPIGEFKDSHLAEYWWKGEDLILMLVQFKSGRSGYRLLDLKTGTSSSHRQMNEHANDLINTL